MAKDVRQIINNSNLVNTGITAPVYVKRKLNIGWDSVNFIAISPINPGYKNILLEWVSNISEPELIDKDQQNLPA